MSSLLLPAKGNADWYNFIIKCSVYFSFPISHERQHGFSRVKVDSMKAEMKKVFEKMVKKRRLIRTGWSLLTNLEE